jgi:hypothetical protein
LFSSLESIQETYRLQGAGKEVNDESRKTEERGGERED